MGEIVIELEGRESGGRSDFGGERGRWEIRDREEGR